MIKDKATVWSFYTYVCAQHVAF